MKSAIPRSVLFKQIFSFALPYFLSCLMQTLYGMADLFIIGQFEGTEQTTAVSVGGQVMHMITVMIVGMAMGSVVLIGKAVGEKNDAKSAKAVGNTVTLFAVLSLVATAALLCLLRPIVAVMSTPEEAVVGTLSYLRICFIGIPFITAYNVISAIFRGRGDAKTPMYFVAVACVANITLDYLFIGVFRLGAAGAALGTTLSQAISVLLSLAVLAKKKMGLSLSRQDLVFQKQTLGEILKVGIPIALQDGFVQISFLLITKFANLRGLEDAAAVGIVEKIISVLFLVPSAMLSTVSALSAQSIGAKQGERARLILRYALMMSVSFGVLSVVCMYFGAETAVGLFTDSPSVAARGGQYMRGYVWDCILAGMHFCFSGYFCACNLSGISFAHNCASILLARVPLAYFASRSFPNTLFPMGLATVAGSCISVVICLFAYRRIRKRQTLSELSA